MTTLAQISETQAQKATTANENFTAVSPAGLFGRKATTTTGLTWGFYGGILYVDGVATTIADGTVALTASQTNYIEATRAGVVSKNTTGFTAGQIPLYTAVTGSATISSYIDQRAWGESFSSPRLTKSVAGSSNVTLTAAEARAEEMSFTGALTGNIEVIFPAVPWAKIISNDTSGAFSLTARTSDSGSPTPASVAVPQGSTVLLFSDGSNVKAAITAFAGALTIGGALTVNGTTALNGAVTIGDNTADALTFHPSAWTLTNAVTITGTWANLGTVTTADINGGTLDGVTIGGATPADGTFTALTATGNVILGDNASDTIRATSDVLNITATGLCVFSTPDLSGFQVKKEASGATLYNTVQNTSNTASSNAVLICEVAGTSSGNAYALFAVVGTTFWAFGLDNADSDAFKINQSTSFAVNNFLKISTGGIVTLAGNELVGASAGTLRLTDGVRIGADSTNNLLDDASTGAGTATLYIGNASINVTSDRRLKANIKGVVETYSDAAIWDMVDRSRVVIHTWNDPSDKAINNRNTRGPFVGLIAQEQKEVTPWAVNKPLNERDPWFIEHVHLVPLLMRDAQITHGHIKDHETRLKALEARSH